MAWFLYLLADQWWVLCKLNLLFVVFCLPIVTLFPALNALACVTQKLAKDTPCDLFYDFFSAFKASFWKSLYRGTVCFLFLAAAVFSAALYLSWWQQGQVSYLLFCGMLLVILCLSLGMIHLFPTEGSLLRSFLKGFVFFPQTFLCVGTLGGVLYAGVYSPLLWFICMVLFLPAVVSFTVSFIFRSKELCDT